LIARLSIGGCLALAAGIALAGAMLHAMGLLKYVVLYGQLLLALASSPDAKPANWVAADAQVVNIEHRTDRNHRHLAIVVLRYPDAGGRQQVGTFAVSSPTPDLRTIRTHDRLTIKVCRHDPAILKSDRFVLSERKTCAPGG
jgi:hypothetical protein